MSKKLNVVLVLRNGGPDYSIKDVNLLAFHIRKNWKGPLQIICLHDKVSQVFKLANNLELHPMKHLWKGWWSKMNIFSPEMEKFRPFLYIDLDTTIVGSLNGLFPPEDPAKFMSLENCYYPGRMGSGLMWIPANSGKIKKIWELWIANPEAGAMDPGGDQGFIEKRVMPDEFFTTDEIDTFKPFPYQHWLMEIPLKLKIIYFHGYPRIPIAAKTVGWISEYIMMRETELRSRNTLQCAFVINLDERKDRLVQFMQQKFPFKIERFSAFKHDEGIKGCNRSHQELLSSRPPLPFVIFEDDCKIVNDWSNVEAAMSQLPPDWDLLYVGANLNIPIAKHSTNLYRLKKAWTTHAIIYGSQRVVEYIIQNMPKDQTPIDVFYSAEVLEKFKCYVVNPIVAIQRCGLSDVTQRSTDYEFLMQSNFKKHTS